MQVYIENFCLKITDGEHLSPQFREQGKPLISAKDIDDENIILDSARFVNGDDFRRFRLRCDPQREDVLLVSRGATIGRVCCVKTDQLFALMGSVILIRTDQKILNNRFLIEFLRTSHIQKELLKTSGSSAQQAIYLIHLKHLKIAIPSLEEQISIANMLNNLAEVIQANDCLIKYLQILKSALMQVLLTGEVRVK